MIIGSSVAFPRAVRLVLMSSCIVLTAGRTVLAQSQSFEFFAGYSFLKDPSHSVLTATARDDAMPLGWALGAAWPLWRAVSIAADVSGHYKHRTTFVDDVTLTYHTVAAGPRASARIGPFIEFAEVLAGAAIAHGAAFGTTVNTTALLLQGGGGLDYPMHSRLALRGEVDYRRIAGSDAGRVPSNQLRIVAAVVVH